MAMLTVSLECCMTLALCRYLKSLLDEQAESLGHRKITLCYVLCPAILEFSKIKNQSSYKVTRADVSKLLAFFAEVRNHYFITDESLSSSTKNF